MKGAGWSDTRSAGYTPDNILPREMSRIEWNSRWITDEQALSSPSSGRLQPPYPRDPEASPPTTMLTIPIDLSHKSDDAGTSGEAGDGPKTVNTVRQGDQSPPLSQDQGSINHAPVKTGNTSAQLERLFEEVHHLQQEVRTKRLRARDLRRALRRKREEEDYFRLVLREKLSWLSPEVIHQQVSTINKAIDDLKTATKLYHTQESDYDRIENELDKEETVLGKRMKRLNKMLRRQAASGNDQNQLVGADSNVSSDSSSSTDPDVKQLSSKAAGYLTLAGEVRLLREQLRDLESEYMNRLNQQHLRERIGISLDPDGISFLAGYEDAKAKTQAGIHFAIRRLIAHPEHDNHPEAVVLDEQWDQVVTDFQPQSPDNQPPQDPLRVTEFEDRSPFFEVGHSVPLNKFTFVNRWLLHQLRHSRFEILQYKTNPGLMGLMDEGWDGDSISQMALMLWYRDETNGMVTVRNELVQ